MRHDEVRDQGQALAYLTECTLATVSDMATRNAKSKSEFKRQISIAQFGLDWMRDFGVDMSLCSLTSEVRKAGSVERWAKNLEDEGTFNAEGGS